jgi:hypothetical protein
LFVTNSSHSAGFQDVMAKGLPGEADVHEAAPDVLGGATRLRLAVAPQHVRSELTRIALNRREETLQPFPRRLLLFFWSRTIVVVVAIGGVVIHGVNAPPVE